MTMAEKIKVMDEVLKHNHEWPEKAKVMKGGDDMIKVCRIDTDDGRRTIYWSPEEKRLYCENTRLDYRCNTAEEALETALSLWGKSPVWAFEWAEMEV